MMVSETGTSKQIVRITSSAAAATGEAECFGCDDGSIWKRLPPLLRERAADERRGRLVGDRIQVVE